MTTIAYKSGILAADTLVTENGVRMGRTQKIFRLSNTSMVAACGNLSEVGPLLEVLLREKSIPDKMLKTIKSSSINIFHEDGSLETFNEHGYDTIARLEQYIYAIGTGGKIALGAMAYGATAAQSVHIASRFDIYTGTAVEFLRFGENTPAFIGVDNAG